MARTGRKILVVDDDPWIAKMLEFVASDAGHTAVVCKDGADAIDKFGELMPDVVLLDVVLPKIDGLKVCEHIKKTPIGRLTPVLVFSGIYRDATEATKFGADAFLAKPFTPQQIGAQIKQMLPLVPEPPAADLAAPPLKPGQGETPLSKEPLPKALGRLHREKRTGVLTLRSRVGVKYLFVENGGVVQVRSPSTASGVTTSLLARGRVTAQELEELEKAARASKGKKLLSQLLVESGLVKAEELRKLVLSQMLWEIFEVFRWREGMHAFAESPPLPASAGQFKLDVATPNLVHWGVRKTDVRAQDVDAIVPSRMSFLSRTAEADELIRPLALTERERGIVALIDGTKTLQEICCIADLAGYDASPPLYTLLCLGAVVPAPPAGTELPRVDLAAAAPGAEETPRQLTGPFALALMELWRSKETGVLRCSGPLDNRAVYVSNGSPIFARSERNADRLDQMLVRANLITPEQAQKSLELQQRAQGKRIGQILVEMGALGLEQLHAAVKQQVQNMVLSLFTWAEGAYVFTPGPLPTEEAITLDWDTPGAVLQGLRGLPLNYIRPLAPPKDAIIERSGDDSILRELTLTSAEQKLLALLVGQHPMEQLLSLDFIAHESLLRGLVTFAALGLIVVKPGEAIPVEEGEGILLDPLSPAHEAVAPPKRPAPENAWPDPVPSESEPQEGWTAPVRRSFLEGPALAAFEAEGGTAPEDEERPFAFAPPDDALFRETEPTSTARSTRTPTATSTSRRADPAGAESASGSDAVPRALYDALVAEKHELQQKLLAVLEERGIGSMVPRELFDQVQAEKRQLQEKIMAMVDELLRLRQEPQAAEKEQPRPGNVRPFPGSRKGEQ